MTCDMLCTLNRQWLGQVALRVVLMIRAALASRLWGNGLLALLLGMVTAQAQDSRVLTWVASLDTLGHANGVAKQGDILFVADEARGLATVDVSDLTHPKELGRVELA